MRYKSSYSRRDFIGSVAGWGVAMAFGPVAAWAANEIDPKVAVMVSKTIGIDTHNHIDVPQKASDVPGPDLDLAGEMKKSGLSAICATFATDYQKPGPPGAAYDRFLSALSSMDAQLARDHMQRALNLKDIQTSHDQGQPTIIQAVEGGHFLEGHLDRVEAAHKRGLRVLGLLHDSDASVPLGDLYTSPAHLGGLTEFGTNVIKECNRLGMLVDLTHAATTTVAAALKVSTKPVVFTHTGLDNRLGNNQSMAKMMRPRLISKEEAKLIADAGGVVGVWTHLVDSPAEYVQAIRAMADVAGIDHVCIGTDTKLTPGNNPGRGPGGEPQRRPDGAGGPPDGGPRGPGGLGGPGGPGGGRRRAGERTNQAWENQKAGFYFAIVDQMMKQGFTEEEIGKVGGGNFCRVFDAATSGHS
jgi:microsomal dipeptidase-like Zn-dependent dipeptidase